MKKKIPDIFVTNGVLNYKYSLVTVAHFRNLVLRAF